MLSFELSADRRSMRIQTSCAGVFSQSEPSRKSSIRTNSPFTKMRTYPCCNSISSCLRRDRPSMTRSGASRQNLVPSSNSSAFFTTSSGVCFFTSSPLTGEKVWPMRAKSNLRYSYISVEVPTVERGLREITFCSMAMAGGSPLMKSHSGLLMRPKNWRAYDERLST